MTNRVVVLDIVGLTPKMLRHMPSLTALGERGFTARLGTVLPAVTCSVQSTFLTGEPPSVHGVVGNGWYFRELGEVLLWRQHNALVGSRGTRASCFAGSWPARSRYESTDLEAGLHRATTHRTPTRAAIKALVLRARNPATWGVSPVHMTGASWTSAG